MTTVTDEIVKFARGKLGTIVRYKPTRTGKCEELVYAALDHAKAEKGLGVINAQKGDIITFANRSGKVIVKVTASSQGKKHFVQEDSATFSRGNHIAIVSKAPDKNGKILVLEQNVGASKSVTESPINTGNNVSYSKNLPSGTNFPIFKREYTKIIEAEFTKEKAAKVVNDPKTWKSLKEWFSSRANYAFSIDVSYSGSGTIKYNRPHKKGN